VATPYHARIAPKARRQIKELPTKDQKMIVKLVETLAINPRPPGAKKVEGMTGLYTEVVNLYRLIYKIEDQEVLILLIRRL
jgi:mRNA interferase RelE/StbE